MSGQATREWKGQAALRGPERAPRVVGDNFCGRCGHRIYMHGSGGCTGKEAVATSHGGKTVMERDCDCRRLFV